MSSELVPILKRSGDSLERFAEIGADRSHDSHGDDRDQRGDQTVLDCRDTGFVFQQVCKKRAQRGSPSFEGQSRAGCIKIFKRP
jgi:hypothetical protein